jgi:signal transduction histidine kinase
MGEMTGSSLTATATATAPGAEWAVLGVRDQGLGIPPTDLPRLFEHVVRGANAPDQVTGSGKELMGVRRIVEQHPDAGAVDSREGEGSVFTMRLPVAAFRAATGST